MDPEGLGGWQVLVYEGILPEASGDGKTCVKLTIESREHSGDGTFTLERFYSEADACQTVASAFSGIPRNVYLRPRLTDTSLRQASASE